MTNQTWKGASGDWKTATLWASGTVPGAADTAIFNTTSSYLATIGTSTTTAEADVVANVTLADANATLQIIQGSTLSATGTFSLLAGSLELDGVLAGGVLLGGSGALEIDFATAGSFSHETISNAVTVTGDEATLDLVGGLVFASGADLLFDAEFSTLAVTGGLDLIAGSTLTLGGNGGNVLQFLDGETVAAGEILASGFDGSTLVAGTVAPVVFASNFTLDVADATILTGSFVNHGTIDVLSGQSVSINPANLTNTGVIDLGVDAQLDVGSLTTGQLTTLANGIVFSQGASIVVADATLDNTGMVLNYATGALTAELGLDTATILRGSIITPAKPTSLSFGTLSGVTVQGPLDIDSTIAIVNGLTLQGVGGSGPGTILFSNYFSGLNFIDAETLDNATIIATGYDDSISGPLNGALTIGSHVTAQISGGLFTFSAATLVNDGTINVASGDLVTLQFFGGSFTNPGVINLAAGGIVELAGTLTTAQLVAAVADIHGAGTIELGGTISNTPGTAIDLPNPTILDADLIGVTIINVGSLTVVGGSTLDDVTVQGPLNLGTSTSGAVTIKDGLTLESAAGTAGGTIDFGGSSQTLYFADAETLSNVTLNVTGGHDALVESTPIFTLGSGFAASVSGGLILAGTTIVNGGTLGVTGSAASLTLATSTLVNDGAISIGTGDLLAVGVTTGGVAAGKTLAVSGPGSLVLASGSTLTLGSAETTRQIGLLLGTQTGVTVDLGGTLFNIGSTLSVGPGSVPSNLLLTADVINGVIVNAGTGVIVGSSTLSGVTFDGPLNTASSGSAAIDIVGGITLQTATGGAGGTVNLLGPDQSLDILDAETLGGAVINLTSSDQIAGNGTLLLGPTATVDVTGAGALLGNTSGGGTIANAGTILVGPSASLNLEAPTIFNSGRISIASGGELGVESGVFGGGGALSVANTGAIALAPGSTLAVGGFATTAQVLSLLGTQTGVTLDLNGTIVNTGTSLATGSGVLTSVTLDAELTGGTLVTSNDLAVIGGEFSTLTVRGPLTLTTSVADLTIVGGLTLQTPAGTSGGTLALAGANENLQIADNETLDHGTIVVLGVDDAVSAGTLSTGPSLVFDAGGTAIIETSSINNAGTLNAVGSAGVLLFDTASINNNGIISAGAGDVIGIGVNQYGNAFSQTLSLLSSGVVHTGGNSNAFALNLTSGATLELGGIATTGQLTGLLGTTTGVAVRELGTLVNTGTSIVSVTNGTFGNLFLDADVIGGTVANRGGTLIVAGGVFDGVTFAGPLNLGTNAVLDIVDGLHLLPATGAGLGTITPSGSSNNLVFEDAETLSNVIISAPTTDLTLTASTTTLGTSLLNLASSATLNASTDLTFNAGTVFNAGTIAVAAGGALAFQNATLINSGVIQLGSAAVLEIDYSLSNASPLDFVNTGSVSFAAGDTLVLGSSETTAQLLALLATLSATTIELEILGTLINTGATLALGTGLLSDVRLDADIIGGNVINGGGSLDVAGGTFDGVTFQGPLDLTDFGSELSLRDGFSLLGPGGGSGVLNVEGNNISIGILDGTTTLNTMTINVTPPTVASASYGLVIEEETGTLSVGSGVVINAASVVDLEAIGEIVSGANVTATNGAVVAAINYDSDTIVNSGTIVVGVGSELGIDPSGPLTAGTTLDFVNSGSVVLASGASLTVGGAETTSQMVALVDGISHTGVELTLTGSIGNAGTNLVLAPGVFGNVLLDGTINGGVVVNAGGTIGYGSVSLQTVTFVGPLDIATNYANVSASGSLTLLNSALGVPGTLQLAGLDDTLDLTGSQTLDNAVALVSGLSDRLEQGSLTLGSGIALTVTGGLTDSGTSLTNNGNIVVSGTSSLVLVDQTVVNTGIITVGSRDVFGVSLAATTSASLPFFNTGGVTLAAGSTFLVGGTETDSQLNLLLGSLSNSAVVVELDGDLLNTGSVFTTTTGAGLLNDVILDATVTGGTINTGPGSLTVIGGDLVGVTYQGSLVFGTRGVIDVTNGIALENVAGASPGALLIDGTGSEVNFLGSQTLGSASVGLSGEEDTIAFGTLTLAPSLAVTVQGSGTLSGFSLEIDTPVPEIGSTTTLVIDTATFTNNSIISVAAGDELDLESENAGTIALAGIGSIALASGSTLAIGGDETEAQLFALIGSIVGSQTGVAIKLDGEIFNSGTTIEFPATGLLSNVILDADVVGGTILSDGGALSIIGGEFQSLTFEGQLGITGSDHLLGISGGLTLETQQGAEPGTLVTSGAGNTVDFTTFNTLTDAYDTLETLSNAVITGSGSDFTIEGPGTGTLGIASSVLSEASGQVLFEAGTIVNAATLLATTPGAAVILGSGDVFNSGAIVVGAGGVLGIGSTQYAFGGPGSLEILSGSTLILGGSTTTAQFESQVASLDGGNAAVTPGFGLGGTLLNSGANLTIGPSGVYGTFLFDQATVLGGTIGNGGTIAFGSYNAFDAVSYVGPLTLSQPQTSVTFDGASSVGSGTTGQESIALLGTGDSLGFAPGATLGLLPVASSQEIDNALIVLGGAGTSANDDSLYASGGGTVTFGAGTTLDLFAATSVGVDAGSALSTTLVNLGTIVTAGSLIGVSAASSTNTAGVFINQGQIVAGPGALAVPAGASVLSVSGSFDNTGTIIVSGNASLVVNSGASFVNTGFVELAAGATVDFQNLPSTTGIVYLTDGAETVRSDGSGLFTGEVTGFDGGDIVDLTSVPLAGGLTVSQTFTNGVLDVFQGTTLVADIGMPSFAYTTANFGLQPDANGGTEVFTNEPIPSTPPPPCFLAGTRIRTAMGDVAVEDLTTGMTVMTRDGVRQIVWIGQRLVDCRRHPHPERVQPVRVRAGAFGVGLPLRDLLLSPDHSVFVDGVLIPVQHLLNGATIVRDQVASAHYFHVELSAHDVIFAEGLPVESYLDTGNRTAFANGAAPMILHPEFFPLGWQNACAPLCQSGPILNRTRNRLMARARDAGYRPGLAAAPVLQVGGRTIAASAVSGMRYCYLLPPGTSRVRIVSGCGVPASLRDRCQDFRQLGVAIGGIVVHGRPIDLDSPLLVSGFWGKEARDGDAWRWTDGCAEFDVPVSRDPGVIELRVLEMMSGMDVVPGLEAPQLAQPCRVLRALP